jgi:hypothetical protein
MKNYMHVLVVLAFSVLSQDLQAKIWRVNNMTGVTADFNNLQSAYDAATAGDTIHVEPSVNNYGGVSCYKRLVWLSVGDFLTQNPGNQFTNYSSYIGYLNFYPGSEGSIVSVRVGSMSINANEVSIIRTMSTVGFDINASNCVVLQSYVDGRIGLNGTNNVISNNIIAGGLGMDYNTSSAVITNNIFNRGIVYYSGHYMNNITVKNSVFQNNISLKGQITFDAFNSTFSNNMCPDNSFPAGNGNLRNVDMSTVFENPTGSSDKDFVTKAGSPSIGAAYGGGDIGPFGGSTPYKLALQPAIPAITNISTPSSTGGNTIQVTISAKSNN